MSLATGISTKKREVGSLRLASFGFHNELGRAVQHIAGVVTCVSAWNIDPSGGVTGVQF